MKKSKFTVTRTCFCSRCKKRSSMSPKVNWAVFNEGPSDGFKIGMAVWGVLRASENSASKILRISKPFSNCPFCHIREARSKVGPG